MFIACRVFVVILSALACCSFARSQEAPLRKSLAKQFAHMDVSPLIEPLRSYASDAARSFETILESRRATLQSAANFIADRARGGQDANLIFICTHNSRRSHLGQAWAQTAAACYGIPKLHAYSGGIEVTACNPRTVQALRRAGMSIAVSAQGDNPTYLMQYADGLAPLKLCSKRYTAPEHPQSDFAAMMCCSEADGNCPVVAGAATRVALHYEDPKAADGTAEEAAAYDRRCRQIAIEMFYVMSQTAAAMPAKGTK